VAGLSWCRSARKAQADSGPAQPVPVLDPFLFHICVHSSLGSRGIEYSRGSEQKFYEFSLPYQTQESTCRTLVVFEKVSSCFLKAENDLGTE